MLSNVCKIVIPSHKRADRVYTANLLNNPIICVAESQREEYERYNPNAEIVCHPDSVIGLIPKRNWMVEHFGDIFMLDDDINCVRLNYIDIDDVLPCSTKDKDFIEGIIYNLYDIAKCMGVNLFGFPNLTSPLQYDEFSPLSLSKNITGCSYGMISNDYLRWNENMKVKEDMWISCLAKYYDRKILVDNRYTFNQKNTMISSGGLANMRNQETEDSSILTLKKHFGSSVKLKGKGFTMINGKAVEKKEKIIHNVTVSFKY